jgi:hypothetical protein
VIICGYPEGRVIPTEVPWYLVPPRVAQPPEVEAAASTLPDERRRNAFLWTTAIVDHAIVRPDLQRLSARPNPDYPWMAAGFVPIPPGFSMPSWVKTGDGFFFGLCLLPPARQDASPEIIEPPLAVGSFKFPILRLPSQFARHQPPGGPPDPTGARTGTAACWAQPTPGGANPTALPGSGILTAAHVALKPSAVTPMTPPSPYAVVGYAIDAAVLYPEPLPASPTRLPVSPAPAVGSNVDVYPRAGGSTTATILLTFQPSRYVGFLCPHRMIIDVSFVAGDSGSLVRDQSSRDAVGLYIGEIVTPGGTARGACQIMQQVVTELALDLYI